MKLELISIPTDTLALDGLWYEPDTPARGAAMLLHGNCMNFYTGAPRFLAAASDQARPGGARPSTGAATTWWRPRTAAP
jgi:hypothetical protein